jgi:L-ascorbate metabolism protein UlaG (beta-lactamase superfamily)
MNDTNPVYLRSDVQMEPLIDRWYAWSQLIPPATAARNLTHRHLQIMDSFVTAPEAHAAAVKDPRMMGGPFIAHGPERVGEIRALADRTRSLRHLMDLSAAISDLEAVLSAEAKGFGLNDLYAKVPAPLRGYVELFYDLNNQPSYRLLEPLLYLSPHYDVSLQSLAMSLTTGDDRPFVLSTPRLEANDVFHWNIPFRHGAIDEIFKMKSAARPYGAIRELVDVPPGKEALFQSFFTSQPPAPYEKYDGATARWRYFGHACVLVETPTLSILFDPVLSYTYESEISRYTYNDLPDVIDYVVITHNHQDHVLLETMLQLRHRIRNVVVPPSSGALQDPSLRLALQKVGFRSVIELGEMDEIQFENGRIVAIPFFGEHADLNVRCKSAYVVEIGKHSLLFAADSCNIEPALYEHLHRAIGDVDVVFIGMECTGAPLTWLYGPLLSKRIDRAMDQSRRLAGSNYEQALKIVTEFAAREVYVYAMGQEPWLNHVMSLKYTERSRPIVESNKLLAYCTEHGIVAERLFGEKEIFLQ